MEQPSSPAHSPSGAPRNFLLSYFVFVLGIRFRGSSRFPAEIGEYDYGARAINLLHKSKLTWWDPLSVTVSNLASGRSGEGMLLPRQCGSLGADLAWRGNVVDLVDVAVKVPPLKAGG